MSDWHTGQSAECAYCHRSYQQKTITQKYCGVRCSQKANIERHKVRRAEEKHGEAHRYPEDGIEMRCAFCGKAFTLMHYVDKRGRERRDMRSRFCSQTCERKYWRHPPQDDPRCYQVGTLAYTERREKMTGWD